MKENVTALIVAAGQGKRFGGPVSKQFVSCHGKPLLFYTLRVFQQSPLINAICLVLPPDLLDFYAAQMRDWGIHKFHRAVAGGAERHDSVSAGLAVLPEETGLVAIHDGVRPLLSLDVIARCVAAAGMHGAAIAAVPPRDTIKRIDGDRVAETIDRRRLILVQTPQIFRKDLIQSAYRKAYECGDFSTDDAALVEATGHPVQVVMGDYRNIKITSHEDLVFVQAFLEP